MRQFIHDEQLGIGAKFLLMIIATTADADGVWSPNMSQLATLMSASRPSVYAWLDEVIESGWLAKVHAPGRGWRRGANVYIAVMEEDRSAQL